MKPGPPNVIGPVSECSRIITLQGQISGSVVKIYANDTIVAHGTASSANQDFNVDVALRANQKITATQEVDGQLSDRSAEDIIVQQRPVSLSHLTYYSHLYQCGMVMRLTGAVSGAEVKIKSGNIVVGAGLSAGSDAVILLNQALKVGETVSASQSACTVVSPVTPSAIIEPVPDPLPVPVVHGPVQECQPSVAVSNIVPGALVALYKNDIEVAAVLFDLDRLWVYGLSFTAGDVLSAQQFMCKRNLKSEISNKVKVGVPDTVPVPAILGPVCPSAHRVTVTGLIPGSKLILFINGVEYAMWETPNPVFALPVSNLREHDVLTVRQVFCDRMSSSSPKVVVGINGTTVTDVLVGPLYACATKISIRNMVRGTGFTVVSAQLGAISDYMVTNSSALTVTVSPALIAGDRVSVNMVQCGGATIKSNEIVVLAAVNPLPAANIHVPVYINDFAITISDIVPGAWVDVYVNGIFNKAVFGSTSTMKIPIRDLQVNDLIKVRQRLCNQIVDAKKEAVVRWPLPLNPVLRYPADGDTRMPRKPILDWSDPGAGDQYLRADDIYVYLGLEGTMPVLIRQTVRGQSSQWQVEDVLLPGARYTWKVNFENRGGFSSAEATFTTENASVPDGILIFTGSILISDDGITNSDPVPPNHPTHAWIWVQNIGTGLTEDFSVFWQLFDDNRNDVLYSNTREIPTLQVGELHHAKFDIGALSAGVYRVEVSLEDSNGIRSAPLHYTFDI